METEIEETADTEITLCTISGKAITFALFFFITLSWYLNIAHLLEN